MASLIVLPASMVLAVLLLLVVSTATSGAGAQSLVALSKAEKQAILDVHNTYRARVARGQTGSQPSAADMMLLEWDDRLAEKAATWAVKCQAGHDSNENRKIAGYSWVGQNWGGGGTTNMSLFVEYWYLEHKDYTYSTGACTSGKMCGHYTQVVWSKSLLIGCASAACSPSYPRTLVCNYAQGGNVEGEKPYETGPAASKCIGEYTYTRGGLCLRKNQCDGTTDGGGSGGTGGGGGTTDGPSGGTGGGGGTTDGPSGGTTDGGSGGDGGIDDGDDWGDWNWASESFQQVAAESSSSTSECQCAIACQNGGTLDSANCKCSCTPDRYGSRCELTCSDPEAWRQSCEQDQDACKNYPSFCPKTCKQCSTGDIADKSAVNEDAVVARVPAPGAKKR